MTSSKIPYPDFEKLDLRVGKINKSEILFKKTEPKNL